MLKQICSFQLQICQGTYDILVAKDANGLRSGLHFAHKTIVANCQPAAISLELIRKTIIKYFNKSKNPF